MWYAKARYYNPHLGRFAQEDPIKGNILDIQSLNLYSYVKNNLLKYVDPMGLTAELAEAWTGCEIKEQELRNQLESLVKEHLNIVEENKNIGYYSTDEAIDIVLKYDGTISNVSERLNVPKAMIQAILFKEIRMKDARDDLADSFVIEYYRYKHEIEQYSKRPLWQKILLGAPQAKLPMAGDSSTGLGQIFAETAIEAYNSAIDNPDIKDSYLYYLHNGRKLNYDDWHDRKDMWYQLRDDKKNIYYVALVLRYKAANKGINLENATEEQIQKVLARYNGTNADAREYGRETLEYYKLFKQFNK